MNISHINNINCISFSARNKNIRKADDIQRKARQTFPMISPSYVSSFYIVMQQDKDKKPLNPGADKIYKKADMKLSSIRDMAANPYKYGIKTDYITSCVPYSILLDNVKTAKTGNCDECAIAALAALTANGYNNSKRVFLGYEIQFINKKTNKIEYSDISPLDHSCVLTTLDKENPQKNDIIVIDPWLGFAESLSGANAKFKLMYKEDNLQNIFSYHRSMFRLKKAKETGKVINFDDYEVRQNFTFYPADGYSKQELKDFGLYCGTAYESLLLKGNKK